jgi:ComF family protein
MVQPGIFSKSFFSFLTIFQNYVQGFIHLFYPHVCLQCASSELLNSQVICDDCESKLPYTHFSSMSISPIDKIFWGRAKIQQANSILFFTKDSIVQKIIFELKYKQNKKAGYLLGRLIAQDMLTNHAAIFPHFLIPIPISKKKQRKRGFNQCQIICEGIIDCGINAVIFNGLQKIKNTITQTHKDRLQRSMQTGPLFKLINGASLCNKHIMIIDDVITTGSTLETAYHCLREATPASISISTAAYTFA